MLLAKAAKKPCVVPAVLLLMQLVGCGGGGPAPVQSYSYYQKPRGSFYTVNPGDTLYSIAWAYGIDYRALAAQNGIRVPYTIYPGQRLKIDPDAKARTPAASPAGPGAPTRSLGNEPEPAARSSPSPAVKKSPSAQESTVRRSAAEQTRKPVPARRPAKIKKWVWPAKGQIVTDFASSGHKGVDISGRLGQPVMAAADGRVVYSGGGLRGYGELIIVKHNNRYLSAYAHNNRILVKEGDEVNIGQRIAEMGSTGTDSVRLHFEIRRDGKPVDPVRYLPR